MPDKKESSPIAYLRINSNDLKSDDVTKKASAQETVVATSSRFSFSLRSLMVVTAGVASTCIAIKTIENPEEILEIDVQRIVYGSALSIVFTSLILLLEVIDSRIRKCFQKHDYDDGNV